MNTDKILIYGERLADLRAGREQLCRPLGGVLGLESLIAIAPFVRAMGRAHAEVLLEYADRGGIALIRPSEDLRVEGADRLLFEMRDVEAAPLRLHSHPMLATGGKSEGV